MEMLEDEAQAAPAQGGQLAVGELRHVTALDDHTAPGRRGQCAHDVEQGGLARAGRAEDRQQLALCDGQGYTVEGSYLGRVDNARLQDADDLGHAVASTFMPSAMSSPLISTSPRANMPVSTGTSLPPAERPSAERPSARRTA